MVISIKLMAGLGVVFLAAFGAPSSSSAESGLLPSRGVESASADNQHKTALLEVTTRSQFDGVADGDSEASLVDGADLQSGDFFQRYQSHLLNQFYRSLSKKYHTRHFVAVRGLAVGSVSLLDSLLDVVTGKFMGHSLAIDSLRDEADVIGDDYYCTYQRDGVHSLCKAIKKQLLLTAREQTKGDTVLTVDAFRSDGVARVNVSFSDEGAVDSGMVQIFSYDAGEQSVEKPSITGDWNIQVLLMPRQFGVSKVAVLEGRMRCSETYCEVNENDKVLENLLASENGFMSLHNPSSPWMDAVSTSPSNKILTAVRYSTINDGVVVFIGERQ